MATLKKKTDKNNKTYYEVRYDAPRDNQGNRVQRYKKFDRKKDAEKFLADQVSSLNKGTYINPKKKLLCEYLNEWIEERKNQLAPNTYTGYETNIRLHTNPFIGGIKLQDLKAYHIRKLYSQLQKDRTIKVDGEEKELKKLSSTSINYVHRVLHKALDDAYKDELLHKNPASLVSPPPKEKYEAAFLTVEQIRKMLEAFKDDVMYIPVLLTISLGLRRGEALGLQWENVDFENKIIKIRWNYTTIHGKPELRRKTKTDSTKKKVAAGRDIVVKDKLLAELKKHRLEQKKNRARIKEYYKSDFVCTWQDGKPFNPSHTSRSFGQRMEKYGLPKIRFHDLRHSNAALMVGQNVNPKGGSDRLGHSVEVYNELYSHLERSVQEQIADVIEKTIWG